MNVPPLKPILVGLLVLVVLAAVVGAGAFLGPETLLAWWHKESSPGDGPREMPAAAELVRDQKTNQPILPLTLRLTPRAAAALGINRRTIVPALPPNHLRALPPQVGTLAYDSDRLFAVRSRFAGEVSEILDAPPNQRGSVPLKPSIYLPKYEIYAPPSNQPRPFTVGDRAKKGQLLAVVWSKDLGDKKAALIDALIDLRRDKARLKDLEKLYYEGATSAATFFEAQRTIQKDLNARNAAERTLRVWKLTDKEINDIVQEATKIQADKRDPKTEKNWARVEVRALNDGIIVEKNTHLGDWVDPSNFATPMFRVADLSKLQVWINPAEEYLPMLQDFLKKPTTHPLTWKIQLQADPKAPPLDGTLLRIAPSLDYTQHTPLLVGLVDNPNGNLLVGQFVTATLSVPLEDDLVEVPTMALNEEKGQSVVFVQRHPSRLEFTMQAVSVAYRFKDFVYVHSKPPQGQVAPVEPEALPVEGLEPNTLVVTESVVELTKCLRDLRSKEELARQQQLQK